MTEPSTQWMIVGAVDGELKELRSRMEELVPRKLKRGKAWQGAWKGKPFLLVRTGVGPRKARAAVSRLLAAEQFRGIVSIGYAGALKEGWSVGELIIPDEIITLPPLDEKRYLTDRDLAEKVRSRTRSRGWKVHGGRMATSHRIVCSAKEKRHYGEKYQAGSVEMESAVLAGLAEQASIPLLVIRVVSDEAAFSLPESLVLLEYIRKRRIRKIARCIFLEPVQSWKFICMMRNARRASRELTRFLLEEVMEELNRDPVTDGGGGG